MRFECPGCGSATPFVTAEGGKPVYCAQCGRGYRFIYGFYHRYLYFVFNHPLLTYFLLFVFALVMARSFPGRLQLLYLLFYTVAYWATLRWAQRSHRYLQQLPTGPHAAPARPSSPGVFPQPQPVPMGMAVSPGPPTSPPPPSEPRPSWLAVLVFLLNLALFPLALVLGTASLSAVNCLLLDLIDGLGGANQLIAFLGRTDLSGFRTQLGLYALGVLAVCVFFLALNIVAFSLTRGRPQRGRELVIWSLVFWLVSTLLLGSPVVSGLHLTTTWAAQERDVRLGSEQRFGLPADPLHQWTRMHAWAAAATPRESLHYFRMVLDREIPESGRHAWIARGLAVDLAARMIRSHAAAWNPEQARARAAFTTQADQVCEQIIRMLGRDGGGALGETALRALKRLGRLPIELPRSETLLAEQYLLAPQHAGYLRPNLVNFGHGRIALDLLIGALLRSDAPLPPPRVGELLRAVDDQPALATRLLEAFEQTADPDAHRHILHAATMLNSPTSEAIVPLLREALRTDGTLRYRAIQALYGIHRHARLPKSLERMKRFYAPFRSPAASRRYDKPSYATTHRTTARLWLEFLQPG